MRFTIVLIACISFSVSAVRSQVVVERAFPNLTFESPVDIQYAPDGSERLFVVEQSGTIRVFPNDENVQTATTFLDIRSRVVRGYEEGLLGLAFHPNLLINRRFIVYYNAGDPLRSVISSFEVSATDQNLADPASEQVILEVEQPFMFHNGGQVRFGRDGYLYISLGDGGGFWEDEGTGEDRTTLLGSILRIDIDNPEDDEQYAIPSDNPFVGNIMGFKEEIYAYGFRNPWRFSFDLRPDELIEGNGSGERIWVGDVGGGRAEEVNLVEPGNNYGWNTMEGDACNARFPECVLDGRVQPIWEYGHGPDGGYAVIGGLVYRGENIGSLTDKYIYGDYITGRIWALEVHEDGSVENLEVAKADSLRIHAFGEDEFGELYFAALNGNEGGLYRLAATVTSISNPKEQPIAAVINGNFPNPFQTSTTIAYTVREPDFIKLKIYNVLGREVSTLTDGWIGPGVHYAVWHGQSDSGYEVPSGVYLYRLTAGSRMVDSGRVILNR